MSAKETKRKGSAGAGLFVSDVKELRRRARSHIERGAVTDGYRAHRETVVRVLNEALATEIVCVLRYKRHYYMASEIHAQMVAQEFAEHAAEEQTHADQIAAPTRRSCPTRGAGPGQYRLNDTRGTRGGA
jgi:hypothetical protein